MVKKVLFMLFIIILLLVIALSALVYFINPNHYRSYLSQVVKDKTGYELTIQGDLRWHVWPKVSILSGPVILMDRGAQKPLLTADNMRLDLELLPLFSKRLVAKNILVKSAIINLTEQSHGEVAKGKAESRTTINQQTQPDTPAKSSNKKPWLLSLQQLQIVDGTLIVQQNQQGMMSFRDVNLDMQRQDEQHFDLNLDGVLNRNQRNLRYTLQAKVNLSQYPTQAELIVKQLNYTLQGADLATEISGDLTATVNYQRQPLKLFTDNLNLTLNDNRLSGRVQVDLQQKPDVIASLSSDKLDITPWITTQNTTTETQPDHQPEIAQMPVISQPVSNELAWLEQFNGKIELQIKQLLAKQLRLDQFALVMHNLNGIAKLEKVEFDMANGHVVAKGSANGASAVTNVVLQTTATNLNLDEMLRQFAIEHDLTGQMNLNGTLTTDTIDPKRISKALRGSAQVMMRDVRLNNINIQQIIQTAAMRLSKEPMTVNNQQTYTEFQQLNAQAELENGKLALPSLNASSTILNVKGQGEIDLYNHLLDVELLVNLADGWQTQNETLQKLRRFSIPLRIYGEYTKLHYQLDLEKLLNDSFKNELRNGLERLKERYFKADANKPQTDATPSDRQRLKEGLNRLIDKL